VRSVPRTRHYVSPGALTLCRPVLAFDYAREAYILRGVGHRVGPVLREDRRRSANGYRGPERRGLVGSGRARMKAAPSTSTSPRATTSARATPSPPSRPKAGGQTRSKAGAQGRSKAARRPRSKNARG
jgi:hypothetical protein